MGREDPDESEQTAEGAESKTPEVQEAATEEDGQEAADAVENAGTRREDLEESEQTEEEAESSTREVSTETMAPTQEAAADEDEDDEDDALLNKLAARQKRTREKLKVSR